MANAPEETKVLTLQIKVAYRSWAGFRTPIHFIPVHRWDVLQPFEKTSPAIPTSAYLLHPRGMFFLDLSLNQKQCAESSWSFAIVKKQPSAENRHCPLILPYLIVCDGDRAYATRENLDTIDRAGNVTKSKKEKPLLVNGCLASICFFLDEEYRECSCNLVWMSVTYNCCHGRSASVLLPIQLLPYITWDNLHSKRFRRYQINQGFACFHCFHYFPHTYIIFVDFLDTSFFCHFDTLAW